MLHKKKQNILVKLEQEEIRIKYQNKSLLLKNKMLVTREEVCVQVKRN